MCWTMKPQFRGILAQAANLGQSVGNYTAEQFKAEYQQFCDADGNCHLPDVMLEEIVKMANVSRITPAWAGKSSRSSCRLNPDRDHLRVGGEKSQVLPAGISSEGSPPRWRGKVQRVAGHLAAKGITPAWAGKRPASQPWSPPLWMMVIRPRP